MAPCSVVGRGRVKLGVAKEWEVTYHMVEGLSIRSEELEFLLLHIGNRKPLHIDREPPSHPLPHGGCFLTQAISL